MLEIRGLSKEYKTGIFRKQRIKAVDDVSFQVNKGEVLGIVGESGSGKSTIAQCITRLIEPTKGEIRFQGTDVCNLKSNELYKVRRKMQMIFQDPDSALEPKMTIGESLKEALRFQNKDSGQEGQILQLIDMVGLNEEHVNRYPHQLSGGQNQRVVLARALSFEPDILIADEPTASLDVSVQAQILALLKDIRRIRQLTMVFISHDMEIVRRICDSVVVMYRGKIVEQGRTEEVMERPEHPYTRLLLNCSEENVNEWIKYQKEQETADYEN